MNDAPVDIGIENNLGDPTQPINGKALPMLGIVAFLDHNWNDKFSSRDRLLADRHRQHRRAGADAFNSGQYALVNLL